MPQCHIFLDFFFSKLNSKHITRKQDKADKSVISTELVKTEEDISSCPLQMDKRFWGSICCYFFCSQSSIILILITTLLARIHTHTLQAAPKFWLSPQGPPSFSGLAVLQKCDGAFLLPGTKSLQVTQDTLNSSSHLDWWQWTLKAGFTSH